MRPLLVAVAGMALLAASPATAAITIDTACDEQIRQVASRIPAPEDRPQAAERMNISEKHIEGALAALDAARIAHDLKETTQCSALVKAAEGLLAAGGWSPQTRE